MKKLEVTVPEFALLALTRGMGGIGLGLLVAGTMRDSTRRKAGLALVAVGEKPPSGRRSTAACTAAIGGKTR